MGPASQHGVSVMRKVRPFAALVLGISLCALGSSPASANRVDPGHRMTWGKGGVSLEQYWIDSAECGHIAAATDLTGTPPARALVIASRMIDNQNGYEDVARALQFASPEVQWDRAARIMESALEACLIERGYVKFELTDGQYRTLKMYEVGTFERRAYLHSLASDPDVLATQAISES